MFTYITIVVILVTILRARKNGASWRDIASFPSCWVNYIIGENTSFDESLSARAARETQTTYTPQAAWKRTHDVLDFMFKMREDNHCHNSRRRTIAKENTR